MGWNRLELSVAVLKSSRSRVNFAHVQSVRLSNIAAAGLRHSRAPAEVEKDFWVRLGSTGFDWAGNSGKRDEGRGRS
jgi:hypothetical protein